MALFKGKTFNPDTDIKEKNEYLDNQDKGISLIRKIIENNSSTDSLKNFENVITDSIFPILAELDFNNEMEFYNALIKLKDKSMEQQMIKVLKEKNILGVGGQFSAGKSCFINAITNSVLPEGQRPTTSIATYIVKSENHKNIAISNSDSIIDIDDDAMQALTHKFYDKFNIGFSRIIKNLVVYTPDFEYPNIAILDTPGYSKSDYAKSEDSSDAELARNQLKTADYLIWLVDSVQGVITQRDLEFISTLNISTPILVVFTKADLETASHLEEKINLAKESLNTLNKELFGIVAYDSKNKKVIIGDSALEDFLNMVNSDVSKNLDINSQICDIHNKINTHLQQQNEDLNNIINNYEGIIKQTMNVDHITSLIGQYSDDKYKQEKVQESIISLSEHFNTLADYSSAK